MKVAVIGSGSWGQALAHVIKGNGHQVQILAGRADKFSVDAAPELIILAIPSYAMREVCTKLSNELLWDVDMSSCCLVGTCKGIEYRVSKLKELSFTSEIVWNCLSETLSEVQYGHLAGPAFAKGLKAKQQTRLILASEHEEVIQKVQQAFDNDFLLVHITDDLMGVQIAGACRTSFSILRGAGTALGYDKKKNSWAAILARFAAEVWRFAKAYQGQEARPETFLDVAFLGDLALCEDPESRNFLFGKEIVEKVSDDLSPKERIRAIQKLVTDRGTVEGYQTSEAFYQLAQDYAEMPWIEAVYRFCHEGAKITDVIESILQRTILRSETL